MASRFLLCLVIALLIGRTNCRQGIKDTHQRHAFRNIHTRNEVSSPFPISVTQNHQNRWVELSPKNLASVIKTENTENIGNPTKAALSKDKIAGATLRKEALILGNPKPSIEYEGKIDHLLGFAHRENVGQPDVQTDVPVIVSLLPNNRDDKLLTAENEDKYEPSEVSGTGRSKFVALSKMTPKYSLRQIFNDSTSKVISRGMNDPYEKPMARNLHQSKTNNEKRFEDLFLRNKAQYDGIDIYKQTRSDYEQFEKLDSSPLDSTLLEANKRNNKKQAPQNRELKDSAIIEEKIKELKELISMKNNHKGKAKINSSSKQDHDEWVSKAFSKLNNGSKGKDLDKKKLFQKLKMQVLFESNNNNNNNSDSDNLESEKGNDTTKLGVEDEDENEKSSEDEYQQERKGASEKEPTSKQKKVDEKDLSTTLTKPSKKPDKSKEITNTLSQNDEDENEDIKTSADLDVTLKKPEDRLPPPSEIKPKPKKSPGGNEEKPVDGIPPPEDLKPGNPYEDRFRSVGAGLQPQTMLSKQSNLLFSYDDGAEDGPSSWQKLNPSWTCEGRKQSPINIKTNTIIQDQMTKNIAIKQHPPHLPLSGMLKNNGHSPTFTLTGPTGVRLLGGTLLNDYFLKQIHFHFGCTEETGSEHFINGIQYPLEMHLVFWDNSTYRTFSEAAKGDRGIAVVAFLFQMEDAIQHVPEDLTQLFKFTQLLQNIHDEDSSVVVAEEFGFLLETLVPSMKDLKKSERVFIYDGSLSTPGCYESVVWIVYDEHPFVSNKQLQEFRALKSTKVNREGTMCNNYRPIQKSFGRKIFSNII